MPDFLKRCRAGTRFALRKGAAGAVALKRKAWTGVTETWVPSSTEASVPGDAEVYRSLTTLARALAQYLLVFPKLPGHLHLPPEKERDTVKFVVMTLEVRGGPNGEGTVT